MSTPLSENAISDLFSLKGNTAVITGASRGIGLAMAEAIAQAGADVIAVSSAPLPADAPARLAVEAAGRRFASFAADLADPDQVLALAARVNQEQVDILINNGGTIRRAPALDHRDEDFNHVMGVNLNSAWVLSREIGRQMVQRGRGKIINTASLLSFQGGINVPGYTASKSALLGLTKALANEWARFGVNVNAIAPGYIATDNTAPLRSDSARAAQILERIPAGRWGNPSDLAGATVFLASAASDYVNGAVLPVDGGWLAR